MAFDGTEVATLSAADFGESLTVDGVAVTGTLVLGVPQEVDEAAGVDRRRRATVRLATTATVALGSRIVRAADSTIWQVEAAPDTEYGERVCAVVSTQRQSEGRL